MVNLKAAGKLRGGWPKTYVQIVAEISLTERRIAALEEEQKPTEHGPWKEAKRIVGSWERLPEDRYDHIVAKYVRHLEAENAKLDEELRCERIDGGKVMDDLRAENAELKATIEHDMSAYGKLATLAASLLKERNEARNELAKRHVKADTTDHLREKLAELTTIYNAIPPACLEAQALVQVRTDSVKQEMQVSG